LCSGASFAQKSAGGLLADAIDNPPAPFRAASWHSGVARLRRDPNLGKRWMISANRHTRLGSHPAR
jgi:hypothetical protein